MHFVYDLIVPKDTAELSPEISRVKITRGKITRTQVRFFQGPHNQVKVKLLHGLYQILPVAGSEALIGDGQVFDVPMNYPLEDPTPELTLVGWSPGTKYPHTISFFIDLEPKSADDRQAWLDLFLPALSPAGGK